MKKINCDAIIFDMDGVLIDVKSSCRKAIELTVNFYLKSINSNKKVITKDVNAIKALPGFNNDWNASYALVKLVEKDIKNNAFKKYAKPLTIKDEKSKLYDTLRNIWQTFYLGSEWFLKSEKRNAPFENKKPLRLTEKLIVSKEILRKLQQKYKFAIATGRPRDEAIFAIKQFDLDNYFSERTIVGLEDTKNGKPSPAPLLEAKKRIQAKNPIYIGDTINDTIAAKKAKMFCVYIGKEKLGNIQRTTVNQIPEVLL